MKTCSQCQKTYTDDNLNFCLEDGAALTSVGSQPLPQTVMINQAPSTQPNQPIVIPTDSQPSWNQAPPQFSMQPPPKSSKTWIWVVGILAVVLMACGGGLAGVFLYVGNKAEKAANNINVSVNRSPSPSPSVKNGSSPSPSPSSSVTSGNSALKTGIYNGTAKNTTYDQSGKLMLMITSVDPSGSVKAMFSASQGLTGSSIMTGTVTSDGKLTLSGKLADGRALAVSATVSGDTISGGYGLAGGSQKSESGNFTVKHL